MRAYVKGGVIFANKKKRGKKSMIKSLHTLSLNRASVNLREEPVPNQRGKYVQIASL